MHNNNFALFAVHIILAATVYMWLPGLNEMENK